MDREMFFHVHAGLDRQGPGSNDDVLWAAGLADPPPQARICDAGCGPGADIAALRNAVPEAQIVAVDKHAGFVTEAKARVGDDPQVTVQEGDLAHLPGPFDMIWCAGALYFLGLEEGLAAMRSALNPNGVLAFSEPCYFVDQPSEDAVAFWQGHPTATEASVLATVTRAGFHILGHRHVSDAGWAAYYDSLEARIAGLRPDASPRLAAMLDLCAAESIHWRRVRRETGYLLTVARLP